MYAQVANDFSPAIRYVYNAGASAIPVGCGVMRAPDLGACAVQDPVDKSSPLRYIVGVKLFAPSIAGISITFLGLL